MAPHMLLLDEPTNNLDVESIEALIDGLNQYGGGLLLITHDARLIKGVDARLWCVEEQNCF
eukprot:6585682-Prorocentrum_lima.AAC.1